MKHEEFVHLHLHSEFSLLDGAIRPKELLKRAEELHMPAVAITDHGNMFCGVDFYQAGMNSAVKPIVGCEVYVAPASRFDKAGTKHPDEDFSHHLILLVKNKKGYKNLCKLVTAGYREGFYYKPRIDKELLSENHEGLIALSACLKGEVARKLSAGKKEEAEAAVLWYKELFGDRYYLEIQDHGIPEQKETNPLIVELAKKHDVKVVATNDAHYLKKENAEAHDALICIGTARLISDKNRMKFSGSEFYLKTAEEMRQLFSWVPEAVTNTVEVANRCNLDLKLGEYHLPHFQVPADTNPQEYLKNMVNHNLTKKLEIEKKLRGEPLTAEDKKAYEARAKRELEVIDKMGFASYFLIVWDFMDWARRQNIPVGPGRGSAAGSLVAYCLGITDIDPIKYELLFERFLNPDRISMPDIDIDFCMDRRDEVIQYVRDKYGTDNVAQIITFGTMKARGAIRDVGRVMDLSFADVDKAAKLIPEELGITLEKAMKAEPKLREMERNDAKIKDMLRVARTLEGLSRHASTHAAGVVIAPSKLTDYLPLYKTSKGDIVTQYSMTTCEEMGLLKMDFLGLRTLTVLNWTEQKIKAAKDANFHLEDAPMDDKKTFQLLGEAKSLGVFQLESSGMRDILRKMKPENFTDIIALVALYRPGPIGSGMIDTFIKRKHGTEEIEYQLPQMEEVLKETYGVIVYQEQVMKLANVLGQFTMGQADTLRKAMGKKKLDVMEKMRDQFMQGAAAQKLDKKKSGEVFDLMFKFAEYGFNKSHSAAYALLSYRTAYLKAHYPAELMASILTSEMDSSDKVVYYRNECRELGIEVKAPNINISSAGFEVDGEAVVFGLAGVKNIGVSAVNEIVRARQEGGEFKSVVDFVRRVDSKYANKRVMEALVKCGAFDTLYDNRSSIFASIPSLIEESATAKDEKESGQNSLFGAIETEQEVEDRIIKKVEPWATSEKLHFEKESVGFYITGHPLEPYQKEMKRLVTHQLAELSGADSKIDVVVCGLLTTCRKQMTKKGKMMAFARMEDLSGSVELVIFPKTFAEAEAMLEAGGPLFIKGRLEVDEGGEAKILAEEINTLNDAKEKNCNTVHLQLNMLGLEEPLLRTIEELTKKHRGKSELKLWMKWTDGMKVPMTAGERFKVAASDEFLAELEKITGSGSVHCG